MSQPFSVARLRRSARFRRLTGVSMTMFDAMMRRLRGPWEKAQAGKRQSGRPWETGELEDHLLIMLVYYRCYVTQEFIDFFCRLDKSAACRAIKRVESLAKPLFGVKREQRLSREDTEAVMLDCTEQPIQRPGDDTSQREHYSGKKKQHTLKTECIVTEKGRIAGVSASCSPMPATRWRSCRGTRKRRCGGSMCRPTGRGMWCGCASPTPRAASPRR